MILKLISSWCSLSGLKEMFKCVVGKTMTRHIRETHLYDIDKITCIECKKEGTEAWPLKNPIWNMDIIWYYVIYHYLLLSARKIGFNPWKKTQSLKPKEKWNLIKNIPWSIVLNAMLRSNNGNSVNFWLPWPIEKIIFYSDQGLTRYYQIKSMVAYTNSVMIYIC